MRLNQAALRNTNLDNLIANSKLLSCGGVDRSVAFDTAGLNPNVRQNNSIVSVNGNVEKAKVK